MSTLLKLQVLVKFGFVYIHGIPHNFKATIIIDYETSMFYKECYHCISYYPSN